MNADAQILGGVSCNASGPLGIDLPDGLGLLETSPGEGGWFPCRGRGLRPAASHGAVRLLFRRGLGEDPFRTPGAYLRGRGVTCLGWGRPFG